MSAIGRLGTTTLGNAGGMAFILLKKGMIVSLVIFDVREEIMQLTFPNNVLLSLSLRFHVYPEKSQLSSEMKRRIIQ